MSRWPVIFILSFAFAFGGCSLFKRKPVPKAVPRKFPASTEAGAPRKAGEIIMLNSDGRFVLIETAGFGAIQTGAMLKTMRGGVQSGVLTVSGQSRGSVIVADITEGNPARGDEVLQ